MRYQRLHPESGRDDTPEELAERARRVAHYEKIADGCERVGMSLFRSFPRPFSRQLISQAMADR